MSINVTPLQENFGAEVTGVDFTMPVDGESMARIEEIFARYAVLVFLDQPIDDEQQIALTRQFGPLESNPDYAGGVGETAPKPPPGSKPIGKTPWSGDHGIIKGEIGLKPKDETKIDPDGNVWGQNPDGSWTNYGKAGNCTPRPTERARRKK
jgi:hypothetical protein